MKTALLPILVICAYAVHVLLAASSDYIKDDMFITLRYAYNLSHHGVLNWNIGLEPVDGYTSFLHTVIVSLAPFLGLTHLDWSIILNLIFGLLVFVAFIWICIEIAKLSHSERPATETTKKGGEQPEKRDWSGGCPWIAIVTGTLLLAVSRPFWFWQTGLLESILFTLFVTTAAAGTLRSIRIASVPIWYPPLLLLVALCRPEGMALAAGFLIMLLLGKGRASASRKNLAILFCLFFIPWLLYFAWHWAYYGYPFPNTYYAKMSKYRYQEIELGLKYFCSVFYYNTGVLLLVPIIQLLAEAVLRTLSLKMLFFYCIAPAYVAVIIYSGGDVHQNARFWLPMLPICLACFARLEGLPLTWSSIYSRSVLAFLVLADLFVVGFAIWSQLLPLDVNERPQAEGARIGTLVMRMVHGGERIATGRWPIWEERDPEKTSVAPLNSFLPSGTSIASTDLGRLAYYAPELYIYDLNSLNDPLAAHALEREYVTWGKHNAAWMIEHRKPDFLITGFPKISSVDATAKSAQEILESDELRKYFPGATSAGMLTMSYPENAQYLPFGIEIGGFYLNLMIREERQEELEEEIAENRKESWKRESGRIVIPGWEMTRRTGFLKPQGDGGLAFYSAGDAGAEDLHLGQGARQIEIVARGDIADGIGPCAYIGLVDTSTSKRYGERVCVETDQWKEFRFDVSAPPGTYHLHIQFINNSPVSQGEDRNLYVKSIVLLPEK